ncbi:MAG: rod shape-determining protein, partial [Firmicutes bacterium]|nr:rod shape-determining protein [Bacillota bacterium]
LTLEPIAAMNAAIPAEIRLLNLAMVDIGAGTSDIAICREGSVVGYTMVTQAGDEITEKIMRTFLVDFKTAENIKRNLHTEETVNYVNVLGIEESISSAEIAEAIDEQMNELASAISTQILELNGGAPSALFMAGGGSKLSGLVDKMTEALGMDRKRIALAGSNYAKTAFSEEYDLNNPEYATPLGIAVSAGMGLLSDSYVVFLNGSPAKLFRNGLLNLRDILMMNGYTYADFVGRTGRNLSVTLDGKKLVFYGQPAAPAVLRINDEETSISSAVHAGDRIDFIPAKEGMPAERTLRDILGADYKGSVLVNNTEASLDTQLKNGDIILTTKAPVSLNLENAERFSQEYKDANASKNAEDKSMPLSLKDFEDEPEDEEEDDGRVEVISISAEEADIKEAPSVELKPLFVFLNNTPLVLPGKDSGDPYYVMDLLQHTKIDFQNLDKPVKMQVNGESCSFQTMLKDNDSVVIVPE